MELSIFLAKFIGLYLLIVAGAMLFNAKGFQALILKMASDSSSSFITLSGVLSLIFGLLIVLTHNIWMGWPIVITIIGWLAIVKGVIRLYFPQWCAKYMSWFTRNRNYYIALGITLLLGLFLAYHGFIGGKIGLL